MLQKKFLEEIYAENPPKSKAYRLENATDKIYLDQKYKLIKKGNPVGSIWYFE